MKEDQCERGKEGREGGGSGGRRRARKREIGQGKVAAAVEEDECEGGKEGRERWWMWRTSAREGKVEAVKDSSEKGEGRERCWRR